MTGPEGRPGDPLTSWRSSTLAVDLGTSHTVAMLRWPDGRTRPLLFDGRPLMPSAVYLDTTHRLHVGGDALRLGQAEPARIEPHPKRHVDAGQVLLGGAEVPVADLFAALLGAVAREAVATAGFLPPAVLTHPASWGARRRAVLTEALARAGWPAATRLVPEPVAAARYFSDVLRRPVPVGAALAVFDLGGGTLDVAVVRNDGLDADGLPRFSVAASGGADDLGGLDLDAALVDHLGGPLAAGEPAAWAALTDPATLAQWRARRQFWEDVRGAKEMLSRSALAPVPVPGVEHAAHLTRDELEAAAGPLIRRGVAEAAAVIRAAGLTPPELAGLFLVGGSSRVPMVARLLHSELGIAPTVLEQPELPVAEGAIVAVAGVVERGPGGSPAAASAEVSTGDLPETAAHAGALGGPVGGAVGGARSGEPSAGEAVPAGPGGPGLPGTARFDEVPDDRQPGGEVNYRPGVAEAATPTPTPVTVPSRPPAAVPVSSPSPSSSSSSASDVPSPPPAPALPSPGAVSGAQPEYAEPVDPWATGEAAAFAASGGSPLYPGSGAPAGHSTAPWPGHPPAGSPGDPPDHRPAGATAAPGSPGSGEGPVRAYRKKWVWAVAAALVVVVGVGATLAVIFWPGYRSLDYQALESSDPVVLAPTAKMSSGFQDSAVIGDRAYFASVAEDGVLGVVAADAESGERLWGSTAAGTAPRWEQMVALPDAVVVFTDADTTTRSIRMVVLGAGDGARRWERAIGDNDGVLFSADVAVLVDRTQHVLRGLDLRTGAERWNRPDVRTDSGTGTAVVAATTAEDLAGPASVSGVASAPDLDDDKRIVQVGSDKSFRVLDAGTGEVRVPPRQSLADPDDEMIAHGGRFFVVESSGTTEVLHAYDLAKQAEPVILYSAPPNVRMSELTACGAERVCWIETVDFDIKKTRVAGVNATAGGDVWRRDLPNADRLVPVGDHVLARQSTSPARVALIGPDGKQVWNVEGEAGRLDGGNLLRFNRALSTTPDDPTLHGEHVGDDPIPLGALSDVRSATCSWNTSVIACVADENFVLQRFAG